MVKMNVVLLYNPKASETKDRLVQVASEVYDINLLPCNNIRKLVPLVNSVYSRTGRYPKVIKYGVDDGFNLSKSEQLVLVDDIIKNTIADINSLEDTSTIMLKPPTMVTTFKEFKKLPDRGSKEVYNYVSNKSEWRVNYSFGVVNSIYNKNLTRDTIFGKADVTQWTYEQDRKIRGTLIKYTKAIAQRLLDEGYDELKHFGLDIIRDNTTGEYYLLELNKAHALNEENCEFFLKGWINDNEIIRE